MGELTPKERLQPSLLDRLTDDAPQNRREVRDRWVLTLTQLRAAVLRDLSWLINTDSLRSSDIEDYPEVQTSVLNYGFPDLSGVAASSVNATELTRMLRKAIHDFEPRLIGKSVKVRAVVSADRFSHTAVEFEIKAELWAHPVPLDLLLKTRIDLETGEVKIEERSNE